MISYKIFNAILIVIKLNSLVLCDSIDLNKRVLNNDWKPIVAPVTYSGFHKNIWTPPVSNHITYVPQTVRVLHAKKIKSNVLTPLKSHKPIIYVSKIKPKIVVPYNRVYSTLPKQIYRPNIKGKYQNKPNIVQNPQFDFINKNKTVKNTTESEMVDRFRKFGPVQFTNTLAVGETLRQPTVQKNWIDGKEKIKESDSTVTSDSAVAADHTDNDEVQQEFQQVRDKIRDDAKYKFPGHWATPRPESGIDLGFTPVQTYLQVRKTNDVKHVPRSQAYEDAETDEELANAERLREVVRTKKLQEVYSEEGYEDAAYDHAGHERNAEHSEGYKKEGSAEFKKPLSDSNYEESRTLTEKYDEDVTDGYDDVVTDGGALYFHEVVTETVTKLYEDEESFTEKPVTGAEIEGENFQTEAPILNDEDYGVELQKDILKVSASNQNNIADGKIMEKRYDKNLFSMEFGLGTKLSPLNPTLHSSGDNSRGSSYKKQNKRKNEMWAKLKSGEETLEKRQPVSWSTFSYYQPELINKDIDSYTWKNELKQNIRLSPNVVGQKPKLNEGGLIARVNRTKEKLKKSKVNNRFKLETLAVRPDEPKNKTKEFGKNNLPKLFVRNKKIQTVLPSITDSKNTTFEMPSVIQYISSLTNAHYSTEKGPEHEDLFESQTSVKNPHSLPEVLLELRKSKGSSDYINDDKISEVFNFEAEKIVKVRSKRSTVEKRKNSDAGQKRYDVKEPDYDTTDAFQQEAQELEDDDEEEKNKEIEEEERERIRQEMIEKQKYEAELSKEIDKQEKEILGNTFNKLGISRPDIGGVLDTIGGNVKGKLNELIRNKEESPKVEKSEEYQVDTDKYPYYYSRKLYKDSPLRFASNPRYIPRKSGNGMEFYEGLEKRYPCPDVSVDFKDLPKTNNSKPYSGKEPRIKDLGDKIQCLKIRYFGEDPLDNPFFKETSIEFEDKENGNKKLREVPRKAETGLVLDTNMFLQSSEVPKRNSRRVRLIPVGLSSRNNYSNDEFNLKNHRLVDDDKYLKLKNQSVVKYHSKYKYHPNKTLDILLGTTGPRHSNNLTNLSDQSRNFNNKSNSSITAVRKPLYYVKTTTVTSDNILGTIGASLFPEYFENADEPSTNKSPKRHAQTYRLPDQVPRAIVDKNIKNKSRITLETDELSRYPSLVLRRQNEKVILIPVDCSRYIYNASNVFSHIVKLYCSELRAKKPLDKQLNFTNQGLFGAESKFRTSRNHYFTLPISWNKTVYNDTPWQPIVYPPIRRSDEVIMKEQNSALNTTGQFSIDAVDEDEYSRQGEVVDSQVPNYNNTEKALSYDNETKALDADTRTKRAVSIDDLLDSQKVPKLIPKAIIEKKDRNIKTNESKNIFFTTKNNNIQVAVLNNLQKTLPKNSAFKFPPRVKYYEKNLNQNPKNTSKTLKTDLLVKKIEPQENKPSNLTNIEENKRPKKVLSKITKERIDKNLRKYSKSQGDNKGTELTTEKPKIIEETEQENAKMWTLSRTSEKCENTSVECEHSRQDPMTRVVINPNFEKIEENGTTPVDAHAKYLRNYRKDQGGPVLLYIKDYKTGLGEWIVDEGRKLPEQVEMDKEVNVEEVTTEKITNKSRNQLSKSEFLKNRLQRLFKGTKLSKSDRKMKI